jgi:hypothetical protein
MSTKGVAVRVYPATTPLRAACLERGWSLVKLRDEMRRVAKKHRFPAINSKSHVSNVCQGATRASPNFKRQASMALGLPEAELFPSAR